MRKLLLTAMLALMTTTAVSAETGKTYFLNIPGHYSKIDAHWIDSMSIPTTSADACADAIVSYAKNNYVYYIGCDVKPLPDSDIAKALRYRKR